MSNTILLIIGIVFVIIAIININKVSNEEKKRHEEIIKIYQEITEYENYFNELVNDFESLIDSTLDKVNNTRIKKGYPSVVMEKSSSKIFKSDTQNEDEDLIKQIFELKQIGLNNKEIAQKLDRGIREIDILLKVNKNVKKVK